MCAHVFWRAACVQVLDCVLPSCPFLPFSPPFLSLLLPSCCPPSHVLPSHSCTLARVHTPSHECECVNEAHAKIHARQGYIPSVPAPWSVTYGGCSFSGDYNGAPLERSGSCPTQSGYLQLINKGITSVKSDSFAGMGACT